MSFRWNSPLLTSGCGSKPFFPRSLRDITKEKWAEQELRRYADGLRAVSRRLVEVQETERRALANELHDLVGQKLTALNIHLNIVKIESAPSMTAQIGARLEDSLKLVEETIECIRDVMAELRPAVLDDYGLTPVLRWYAEQYVKRTGVATTVIEQGLDPPAACGCGRGALPYRAGGTRERRQICASREGHRDTRHHARKPAP